jgi:excisionase family DNA binding protein
VWDNDADCWIDPDTGTPLMPWADALDLVDCDPDATPAHVVRFGAQVDAQGINAGSKDADRTIGYITKYVTKSAADCHTTETDRQRDHLDRLWRQLRITPCSDRCANWLLYGIAPKKAHARLRPGNCKGKTNRRDTLGIGGRRVLVSRDWSGKTLADHRADTKAWVRALLGVTTGHDEADPQPTEPGTPAPVAWELARPDDPDMRPLAHRLLAAVSQRIQWRAALLAAKGPGRARHPKCFGNRVISGESRGGPEVSALDIRHVPTHLWEVPTEEMPPILLRPEQAARVLNLSRSKVFELIRLGELRSVRSGGSRRISATAIREYVARLEAEEAA